MTGLLGGRRSIGVGAVVAMPWGLCPPFGVHRVPPSLVKILVYLSTLYYLVGFGWETEGDISSTGSGLPYKCSKGQFLVIWFFIVLYVKLFTYQIYIYSFSSLVKAEN
jgi:hypothetical protein